MTPDERQLRKLKWIAVGVPLLFLLSLEVVRARTSPGLFDSWPGFVLIGGLVLLGTLLFAETLFNILSRMQVRSALQNQELLALHEAGIAIAGDLELDRVLQQVVDLARELGQARYGALSILDEGGGMQSFLTSGITSEERAAIGPIPVGHGLLGAVTDDGKPLRLPDLASDSRSYGFPPNHPPMHSLLAVPVTSRERILGSLYLTEKEHGRAFDEADQQRLERFATQAAIAIENARLHQQVWGLAVTQERERIAREMHDSIAQVLGYVNTKAQAAQQFIASGETNRAETQIAQLAEAAREAYADVRENILGLRTSPSGDQMLLETLREYLRRWQDQNEITVHFNVDPPETTTLRISSLAELQLLRIIQEALSNVRKHANAQSVAVDVCADPSHVRATIVDDGIGFDPDHVAPGRFPRFGLTTMLERAQSANGTFEIDSEAGRGTRVSVSIPCGANVPSPVERQS